MTTLWDPHTLLKVDPMSTAPCVWMLPGNKRCGQQFFAASDRNEAVNLLNEMAVCQPASSRARLSWLAEYTLCRFHHRKSEKINKMASAWWATICERYPNGIVLVILDVLHRAPLRTLLFGSEEQNLARRWNLNQHTSTPPHSPSPVSRSFSVYTSVQRTSEVTPIAEPTPASQPPVAAAISLASGRSPTGIGLITPPASPWPLRSPTLSPSLVGEEEVEEEETEEEEVETRNHRASISSAEASLLQIPPVTPRRSRSPAAAATRLPLTPESTKIMPCSHSSRRKPLVDDCPVCDESMHCLDDAVWCRAQCGQNMHRSCFALWRSDCMKRKVPVTCGYCRSQWKYEWED